jgi:hypothetical protein
VEKKPPADWQAAFLFQKEKNPCPFGQGFLLGKS